MKFALVMEAVGTAETSISFLQIHGATYRKTVVFNEITTKFLVHYDNVGANVSEEHTTTGHRSYLQSSLL
jgi:hypothetical protein